MDSTGIGFLIGRYKKLKRYDMEMMLENPDMQADKVLSLSGIYSLIPKI
jgi:anti-anti-sigma factor